jgi:hypothetical protein
MAYIYSGIDIRYGTKALMLNSKGDTAIAVGEKEALPATLQLVIDAVNAGELDAAVDEVAALKRKKAAMV